MWGSRSQGFDPSVLCTYCLYPAVAILPSLPAFISQAHTLFSQSHCKLPYGKQVSGFIVIVSSATYHSVIGPFVHWADCSRYIDPGTLYHCLVISVNCEIRVFLWQFQSIDRSQVSLPIWRRERNLMQCFFKKWTLDSYRIELSCELMLSR